MFFTTTSKIFAAAVLLAALVPAIARAQQTVNPATGISWPGSCTAGQVYSPNTNVCLPQSATMTIANAALGTINGTLTKLTGNPSTATIATVADAGGIVGIVISGAGFSGNATIQISGVTTCPFSSATTAGDYVQNSTLTSGDCSDAGTTYPTSGQVIGRVLSTNATSGTYSIDLFPAEIKGNTSVISGGIPGSIARADGQGSTSGSQYLTPSGMYEFGDSICGGTGATAVTGYNPSPYSYIYGLHMMYGEPFFNDCANGSQAQDVGNLIYSNVTPTLGQNIPVQVMVGTNDVQICGVSTGCENNYTAALTSLAAAVSIPNEFKLIPQTAVTGGACSTTGTWTNTTVGAWDLALQTTVAGSTITCTSYGGAITLPAVYVNWICTSTGTSSATFSINGSNVGTLSGGGFGSQACSTGDGSTTAEFGQRFALTGSGPYTYKITVNTAAGGNPFTVLWIGSPVPFPLQQSNIGAVTANPPVIGIAGVPKQQNDANSALTSAYNTLAQNVATSLAGDGADVVFIPIRNYLDVDSATTDCDMSGCTLANGDVVPASASPGLHPNGGTSNGHWVGGHKHLRDAFIAAMPPAPPNYASILTCNTFQAAGLGSNYTPSQWDCYDFFEASSGGVSIVLPQFPATSGQPTALNNGNAEVTIFNDFSYAVPITLGTGVFNSFNLPPLLAPQQSMTFKGFWWNNSGTQEYSWSLKDTTGPESFQDWFYLTEFGNFTVSRGQSFYYEASASATVTISSTLATTGPYSIYNGTSTSMTVTGATGNIPTTIAPSTLIVFRSINNTPRMEACYGTNCPITGVYDASSAGTGVVGEDQVSNVAVGSAVSLSTGSPKTVTSLSLTAGDWSVEGNCNFTASSATVVVDSAWAAGINTTTNTLPSDGTELPHDVPAHTTATFKDEISAPWKQINVSSSTTAYLVCEATFTAGTVGAYGHLEARRMR